MLFQHGHRRIIANYVCQKWTPVFSSAECLHLPLASADISFSWGWYLPEHQVLRLDLLWTHADNCKSDKQWTSVSYKACESHPTVTLCLRDYKGGLGWPASLLASSLEWSKVRWDLFHFLSKFSTEQGESIVHFQSCRLQKDGGRVRIYMTFLVFCPMRGKHIVHNSTSFIIWNLQFELISGPWLLTPVTLS